MGAAEGRQRLRRADGGYSPGFITAAQVNTVNVYESVTGKTCVPFNPFGEGRNSAAAIDYIQNISWTDQDIRQDAASVSMTGAPFALPAGDVASRLRCGLSL